MCYQGCTPSHYYTVLSAFKIINDVCKNTDCQQYNLNDIISVDELLITLRLFVLPICLSVDAGLKLMKFSFLVALYHDNQSFGQQYNNKFHIE